MKTPNDAKWIKAEKGEELSIVYCDKEGNKMIRRKDPTPKSLKGSKAWRHNNPPEQRWVTREEAINLAEKHLLRAVVVHNKKHTYLHPFPHETPYKDLIC